MATNITEAIFRQGLGKMREGSEAMRQLSAQKKKDYFEGYFISYRDELLLKHFSNIDNIKYEFEYYNLIEKITTRRSKTLKNGFTIEADQDIFAQALQDINIVRKMKLAEKYSNLLGMTAFRFYASNGKIETEMLTPNRFWLITDNSNSMKLSRFVWCRENFTETHIEPERYFMLDDVFYTELDNQLNIIAQVEHGFKSIPIALCYMREPSDYIYVESDDDLMISMEQLAIMLTALNHTVKYQGFSQPTAKGLPEKAKIKVDPSTIIRIPFIPEINNFGEFSFETPDSKISEIWEIFRKKIAAIANRYNVSVGDITKTDAEQAASGKAIQYSQFETQEEREDNNELWRGNIKAFARKYLECLNSIDKIYKFDQNINININDTQIMNNIKDETDAWLIQIAQGVKNRAQWLMELDPDIKTIDEAIQKIKENEQINASVQL